MSDPEIVAGCANVLKKIPFRIALLEMGHPQNVTPLKMDDDAAFGILNSRTTPKKSKGFDMGLF